MDFLKKLNDTLTGWRTIILVLASALAATKIGPLLDLVIAIMDQLLSITVTPEGAVAMIISVVVTIKQLITDVFGDKRT